MYTRTQTIVDDMKKQAISFLFKLHVIEDLLLLFLVRGLKYFAASSRVNAEYHCHALLMRVQY